MKIWLIVAACLVLVGLILFVVVMTFNGWDFRKLSTTKYVTNTYEITDDFENIIVDTNTADVAFYLSADDTCKVVCEEDQKLPHTVTVSDGILTVKLVDNRAWYEYIGVSFGKTKISVYLPKSEYGVLDISNDTGNVEIPSEFSFGNANVSVSTGAVKCFADVSGLLKIKASTGDVTLDKTNVGALDIKVSTGTVNIVEAFSAGEVKIEVSTGKTNISELNCKDLITEGDTGRITLKNVIASGKFDIERSTGHVTFEACDAAEIYVETDTGDVRGTFLTDKIFMVETDTGRIDVPKSVSGGRCEIETDTGDVKISIS